MRQKMIAGNWKMNTTLPEAEKLAKELVNKMAEYKGDAKIVIAPPFTHLTKLKTIIDHTTISLGAQNLAWEASGAYTGEISASMLSSVGTEYVIIGHSERRQFFNESNVTLSHKTTLALHNNLKPIFCIGENLSQRESDQHRETVHQQLEKTVFELSEAQFQQLIIAYEPVWAIGTGKVATPEQAQEMHAYIRKLIKEHYTEKVADETTILYGGSCKPGNASDLFKQPDVDGGLIGGASLKADDFFAIINA